MILFLSLFLQLKIRSQGQVPRLGGANKVGVYKGDLMFIVQRWEIFLGLFLEIDSRFCNYFWK